MVLLKQRMSLLPLFFALTLNVLFSSGCSGLFYQPSRDTYFDPIKNGFTPTDVWFESADHTKLHAWFFAATDRNKKTLPRAIGTIAQFHGNAENISSHFASLVWLTRQGYNLFIFDYRGYGQSNGEPDPRGVHLDAMAALDEAWAWHTKSKAKNFIVYAQSLGGIIATRAYEEFRHQPETLLLVLDSSFCSFKDMVQEKMASIWISWPFSPLGRLSVSDKYASESSLQKIKTPLLVIHDEHDPVVDIQNSEKIFKLSASAHKDFWRYADGHHVGVFALDHPEHREAFLNYLRSLAENRASGLK